jgi:hypothetical protein
VKAMETITINDKQGMEICENVGRVVIEKLDSDEIWRKVEEMLVDYLKNNGINLDSTDLTCRLEWSVRVKLKK